MLRRVPLFILLVFLLFNLPFPDIKSYKKKVYIYRNKEAEEFLDEHPDLKHLVHLTRNKKLKPLLLITSSLNNMDEGNFSRILIEQQTKSHYSYIIPAHANAGDTLYFHDNTVFNEKNEPVHAIVIKIGHNFVFTKLKNKRYRVDIKGIPEQVYVIDSIGKYEPYHGALRRYFRTMPFVSYVGIKKYTRHTRYYLDNHVKKKNFNLKPKLLCIGKDLIIDKNTAISNPSGLYLAYKDSVYSTTITLSSDNTSKNIHAIAYLIGRKKIPFAYIKGKEAHLSTEQIDRLSRRYPVVFKSIMDSLLSFIITPVMIAYPQKHFIKKGEPLTINVICIPFCGDCDAIINNKKQPCLKDTSFLYSYTFIPDEKDSIVIISNGNIADTVSFHVLRENEKILYNSEQFKQYIISNSYSIKTGYLHKARNSTIFYILLLFTLIFTWVVEKQEAEKD